MSFTSCWQKFSLNLETSKLHELSPYEKWIDFSQYLEHKGSTSISEKYRVKNPAGKNILIHRKDKGNILFFNYHYTPEEKEEAEKTMKGLLDKLHPDTRKAIKIDWNKHQPN
jgi:hypothetical protein